MVYRFKLYEEEFYNSTRIINRELKNLENANGNVDSVILYSVEVEGELSETEGYMKAMEVEIKNFPAKDRQSGQQKLTNFKDEYRQLLQRYQLTKQNAEAQALKGGPSARAKLINSNQKLDQSSAMLEETRRVLAATEQTGNVILTDLESQKETLTDAHSKVKEVHTLTDRAREVLADMKRRAIAHKVCLFFTIIVLMGIIVGLAYYGFAGKKPKVN